LNIKKLCASEVNIIIYPLFKYLPEESKELFIDIIKMILHKKEAFK
jgi:hypothetical protein